MIPANIPAPVLIPSEKILEVCAIEGVRLLITGKQQPLLATIIQQEIDSFYGSVPSPNYDYCIVYVTTRRIMVLPVSASHCILDKAFDVHCGEQIQTCTSMEFHLSDQHYRKFQIKVGYQVPEAVFYLVFYDHCADQINQISPSISSLNYLHQVAEFLEAQQERDKKYRQLEITMGDNLFFSVDSEEEPGELSVALDEKDYGSNMPPSYGASERAVGRFFNSTGLLNYIKVKSSNGAEELEKAGNGLGPSLATNRSQGHCVFVLEEKRSFEHVFGNHKFRFLARNCLRYTERYMTRGTVNDGEVENEEESRETIVEANNTVAPHVLTEQQILFKRFRDIEDSIAECMGTKACPRSQNSTKMYSLMKSSKEPVIRLTRRLFTTNTKLSRDKDGCDKNT